MSNAVSSQIKLHAEYGGVVPELAAREHLRNLVPVAQTALREAEVTPEQLDAVAATQGPGLPIALLVGLKAAQAVAFALRKPFVGINHHEAHLYSPWISRLPASLPMNPVAVDVSPRTLSPMEDSADSYRRLRFFADFSAFQPNFRSSSAADTHCWSWWNRN